MHVTIIEPPRETGRDFQLVALSSYRLIPPSALPAPAPAASNRFPCSVLSIRYDTCLFLAGNYGPVWLSRQWRGPRRRLPFQARQSDGDAVNEFSPQRMTDSWNSVFACFSSTLLKPLVIVVYASVFFNFSFSLSPQSSFSLPSYHPPPHTHTSLPQSEHTYCLMSYFDIFFSTVSSLKFTQGVLTNKPGAPVCPSEVAPRHVAKHTPRLFGAAGRCSKRVCVCLRR